MEDISIVKKNFINYIDSIIDNKKISHAYLIEIDDFDSDIKYVYDFIKMILCNIKYKDLCSYNDPIIKLIDSNNFPDIKIISSDSSVINKSLLIDLMKEFNNKSLYDNKRFYIIRNAEKLNSASANTILKFLEEPEEDIIAILLTDNRYHIIDTILSRCQILSLKESDIIVDIDDNIIDFCDLILHPTSFFIKYNYYAKEYIVDKNFFKDNIYVIENLIFSYLFNKANDSLSSIFGDFDDKYLVNIVSIVERELPKLDYNVNFKLWLDSFFSYLIGG